MGRKSLKIKLKVILLSMASLSKQPIEKIREVNFDFSENKVQPNFGLNENINGLVYKRKGEVHCPEFSGECFFYIDR